MRPIVAFTLFAVISLAIVHESQAKKTKKKSKAASGKNKGFDSKTLKCLVCRAVVDEFESAIYKVDPKKMVEGGSYRLSSDGSQKGTVTVPYARSQTHLTDLVEGICERMEDYAQARWKRSDKPTLIRMVNPDGNMNPNFPKVDVVQDDDLNTALKFHCETIVEDHEDDFTTVLSKENPNPVDEICVDRTDLCSQALRDEL